MLKNRLTNSLHVVALTHCLIFFFLLYLRTMIPHGIHISNRDLAKPKSIAPSGLFKARLS